MIDFIYGDLGGLTVENYTKALQDYTKVQREAGLSTLWVTIPEEIEMDYESQMERRIGSEPLIPTRGTSLYQFIRPQKDQVFSRLPEPSTLQRLPDEILLMIVSCVSDPDDKPSLFAFFALRQMAAKMNIYRQSVHWVVAIASTISPLATCRMRSWKGMCLPREDGDLEDFAPRVFATNHGGCGIMLHILWQGHSGSDRSILHQSGYLHRHKLNDSLRKIRQNGGQLFLPQRGPNTLPEWNAISEIDRSEVVSTEEDLIKLRGGWGYMNRQRRHNLTFLGPERIACGHCRKIRFADRDLSCAPHDWFHAIDRKSYVYNGPAGVPEACNNDVCRNHYVGQEDQVYQWIQSVNRLCEIGDDRFGNRACTLAAEEKQPYEDDRRTFESWEDHDIEESEEALAPREQPRRNFESREGHRTEESEEALKGADACITHLTSSEEPLAPREPATRFNLHSLTTTILGAFNWQYWQTGRAQLSAD
ncbi:hypothetical protein BKA60DRAFT_491473 [Fusarium oxysporum]|nr:hypothetical protein BKA60DRAFT_491473 [Fusarium oxysporum]